MRMLFAVIALSMPGSGFAADESEEVTVRVYSVADLVVPASGSDNGLAMLQAAGLQLEATADAVSALAGRESRSEMALARNLEELVSVIRTTTVPGEWESEGGSGRVVAYQKTLSLIIRQTAEGHAEVAALLKQLRAENEVKVSLRIEYLEKKNLPTPPLQGVGYTFLPGAPPVGSPGSIDPPQQTNPQAASTPISHEAPAPVSTYESTLVAMAQKHGTSLTDEEMADFRRTIEPFASNQDVYNGDVANGRPQQMMIGSCTAVISPDRRYVDFHMSSLMEIGNASGSVRIPSNQTAILGVPSGDGDSIVLLVRASVQVPEEEEELIE